MQTLWARAAQTRCTCNCTFCQSTTTVLSRRATSAPIKKRLRFRDVFTVFYSSVLASAAVADGNRKEAKKTEWGRLIKEARDDLKALEEQQQARLAAISWEGDEVSQELSSRHDTWFDVFRWATKERERRKRLGFECLKGPPLSLLENLSAPEIETLMVDKYIARLNATDGEHLWNATGVHHKLSIKKVKTLEWSIRKLVHRLILFYLDRAESVPRKREGQPSLNSQSGLFRDMSKEHVQAKLDRCDQRLRFLSRHSSNTEYWYRFMSPNSPIYSRKSRDDLLRADRLNIKLHDIFKLFSSNTTGKDGLIADICSALLLSYAPPDIHTYNILIIHFLQLKQMNDVEAVITSLRESHVRPNEVTLSAMLHFYTINNKRKPFIHLLRMMDGKCGGLGLAHAATKVAPAFATRYRTSETLGPRPATISEEEEDYYYERGGYNVPAQPRAECHGTRKVVQSANMTLLNRVVYGAIIDGALKFFGPIQARRYYSQMVRDGWQAGRRELSNILRHCCYKKKWQDGLVVWREICNLPEGADRMALVWMLRLCRNRGEHVQFGKVLDYGLQQKLIPYTIWDLPNDIWCGAVSRLLRSADVLWSAKMLASPITVVRDFTERKLEALGYRIANIALNLDEISLDACQPSDSKTGLNVYLSIRRLHLNSPTASTLRAREIILQGLLSKSEPGAERQGMCMSESVCSEQPSLFRCSCCGAESPSVAKFHTHLLTCSMIGVNATVRDTNRPSNSPGPPTSLNVEVAGCSVDQGATFTPSHQKAIAEMNKSDIGVDITGHKGKNDHESSNFQKTTITMKHLVHEPGHELCSKAQARNLPPNPDKNIAIKDPQTDDKAVKVFLEASKPTDATPEASQAPFSAEPVQLVVPELETQLNTLVAPAVDVGESQAEKPLAVARSSTSKFPEPKSDDSMSTSQTSHLSIRSYSSTIPVKRQSRPAVKRRNLRVSLIYDDEHLPEQARSSIASDDVYIAQPIQPRLVPSDMHLEPRHKDLIRHVDSGTQKIRNPWNLCSSDREVLIRRFNI